MTAIGVLLVIFGFVVLMIAIGVTVDWVTDPERKEFKRKRVRSLEARNLELLRTIRSIERVAWDSRDFEPVLSDAILTEIRKGTREIT